MPIVLRLAMLVLALGLTAAAPALAHHPMGGTTPATLVQGLLSGFGHPIIGIDHLAAIVAVGVLAAALPRAVVLPIAFVLASLVGVAVHVAAIDVPAAELAIAVSVMALGILLLGGVLPRPPVIVTLGAVAGFFHGYAFGESIIGAEPTPLVAYLVGLAVVQIGIALAAMVAARSATAAWLPRAAGALVLAVGLVALASA